MSGRDSVGGSHPVCERAAERSREDENQAGMKGIWNYFWGKVGTRSVSIPPYC